MERPYLFRNKLGMFQWPPQTAAITNATIVQRPPQNQVTVGGVDEHLFRNELVGGRRNPVTACGGHEVRWPPQNPRWDGP